MLLPPKRRWAGAQQLFGGQQHHVLHDSSEFRATLLQQKMCQHSVVVADCTGVRRVFGSEVVGFPRAVGHLHNPSAVVHKPRRRALSPLVDVPLHRGHLRRQVAGPRRRQVGDEGAATAGRGHGPPNGEVGQKLAQPVRVVNERTELRAGQNVVHSAPAGVEPTAQRLERIAQVEHNRRLGKKVPDESFVLVQPFEPDITVQHFVEQALFVAPHRPHWLIPVLCPTRTAAARRGSPSRRTPLTLCSSRRIVIHFLVGGVDQDHQFLEPLVVFDHLQQLLFALFLLEPVVGENELLQRVLDGGERAGTSV
mmetsp:Transcript_21482/g.54059  ORF Transcript_21482/g.54059 Transcript_21482/m.54059 type:complete len:309 (-) Transcript_21482:3006-3932(-)